MDIETLRKQLTEGSIQTHINDDAVFVIEGVLVNAGFTPQEVIYCESLGLEIQPYMNEQGQRITKIYDSGDESIRFKLGIKQ